MSPKYSLPPNIPTLPGIYIMKDKKDKIIYIGKAKNLKKRVRSYFSSTKNYDSKTTLLIKHIRSIDYIVTSSETDALILECNLIKKEQPKYNITLKDNKSYPFIKVTTSEPFPRVFKTRSLLNDNNLYFGPYPNASSVYHNLQLIHKIFPLRTCSLTLPSKSSVVACLDYHIKKCAGCCIDKISTDEYSIFINKVILFLKGKYNKLIKDLKSQMFEASDNLLFEKAASIKKQIDAISHIQQRQTVLSTSNIDADAFGYHILDSIIIISILFVREGKLLGKRSFVIQENELLKPLNIQNALFFTIKNFYSNNNNDIPKEIIIPSVNHSINNSINNSIDNSIDNINDLQNFLKTLSNHYVTISSPKRGLKHDWLLIASNNAKFSYIEHQKLSEFELILKHLQNAFKLKALPRRIEGFDISHTDGSFTVASMVSFFNGKPLKKDYRHFKIKSVDYINDVASISEVIARRYSKIKNGNLTPPDLILVDGGISQVNAAFNILKALELDIPTIGLAKRNEDIFLPYNNSPLALPKNNIALHLLQQIRDEAHRFAKQFHKKLRSKNMVKSILDEIPGVGAAKKQALLMHFKIIDNIKFASFDELCLVDKIDKNTARSIHNFFADNPS